MPLLGEMGGNNTGARNKGHCWRFCVGLARREGIAVHYPLFTSRRVRGCHRYLYAELVKPSPLFFPVEKAQRRESNLIDLVFGRHLDV